MCKIGDKKLIISCRIQISNRPLLFILTFAVDKTVCDETKGANKATGFKIQR
jgi:hypothetical protein